MSLLRDCRRQTARDEQRGDVRERGKSVGGRLENLRRLDSVDATRTVARVRVLHLSGRGDLGEGRLVLLLHVLVHRRRGTQAGSVDRTLKKGNGDERCSIPNVTLSNLITSQRH